MTRQSHRPVQEQLVDWAESSRPLPSPELARFLGPLRPVPAVATGRRWQAAVRTGLGLKVMALVGGLAITSAAAVGVAQVALREPEPRTPAIAPAEPTEDTSSSSADPTVSGSAATAADESPTSSPTGPALASPRAGGAPAQRTHVSHSPAPSPSAHPSTPSPDPSDPSTEPSDGSSDSSTPEPSDPVGSAAPTTEDPTAGATSG